MMTASDTLATVPPSVQLTLLGIGALFLAKKTLDFLPLVSSLVLGGTSVRSSPPAADSSSEDAYSCIHQTCRTAAQWLTSIDL